ncbi:MAG TPA: hypothetical protein PKJ25_10525 [Smithellaceae bacterium]|jgi:hypothetical protein|nr:hypothetical protein [Smithellaceae bacterium]HOC61257.1 hypothetical protein [Smithellaceae bacterium]HQP25552.1 hypothetical protein [Smithellaceae bacterium]
MKNFALSLALVVFWGSSVAMAVQEHPVTGSSCYQFGDSETPLGAKKMATELAKRNALENYITFVASTTKIENFEVRKDSIISAGCGYLHNMKVISDQKKDREYCVSVSATIQPDEVENLMKTQLAELKKDTEAGGSDGKVSLNQWKKISDARAVDSVEKITGGEIDWGKRLIRVTGFGAANKSLPRHIWKKDAEDNAILDAQARILEISKGVDIEAKKYIENYQNSEQSMRKSVQGRVKRAYQVSKTKFSAEGDTAEVIMEAKLPEE